MQLYHILKLKLGLYLLNHDQLQFVDAWYYSYKLQKECIITFTKSAGSYNQKRWASDLITSVINKKSLISYIHFSKEML